MSDDGHSELPETSSDSAGDELDRLILRYLEGVQDGAPEARLLEELCAAHPDRAEPLRRGIELLRRTHLHPGPSQDGLPERVGPFRLERRLGLGGMGVVYLAHQDAPARAVALKLVRPDQLWFEGYRERFRREIESAGRLSHPGIAQVHQMGEHDGVPWFSQEYVVGASLGALLGEVSARSPEALGGADLRAALADTLEEPVPDTAWDEEFFRGSWSDVCLRIARQVAEALQHAHERGVLHRDVKPSNVLLTPGGRAVLVDFGLASLQGSDPATRNDRLTKTGAQLGSLHYMPPEQVDGRMHEVDARSDVYSLGVTLYELLTLRTPYASQSVQRLRGLILAGDPVSPRRHNPAVGRDVDVVCLKAMDPVPARRYASAAAFAADLSAALGHLPVAARSAGLGTRLARWARRRPALAVASVAAFLLVVVAPSVFAVQSRLANRRLQAALEAGDELLDTTLEGFDDVVRWTAQDTLRNVPGYQEKRLAIIDRGIELLGRAATVRPESFGVQLQQAYMIRTRANILENLGRAEEALGEYERAAAVFERADAARPDYLPNLRELASVRYMQGLCARELGQRSETRRLWDAAIEHQRRAAELGPADARNHRDLAIMAQAHSGGLVGVEGRNEESEALLDEALASARRAVELDPGDPRAFQALYLALKARSDGLDDARRPREALEGLREGLEALDRAHELSPQDRDLRANRVQASSALGALLASLGLDLEQAIAELDQAVELAEGLVQEFPSVEQYDQDRLEALGRLGFARGRAGDRSGRRAAFEEIAAIMEERADAAGPVSQRAVQASAALANLANAVLFDESLGDERFERMLELCERGEARMAPFVRANQDGSYGELRAFLAYGRGAAFNRLGRPEGVAAAVESLQALPPGPPTRHLWAAALLDQLADLTGDELHRERGLEELEALVEQGFADLGAWEEAEFELEYEGYPRVNELGDLVRERARGGR